MTLRPTHAAAMRAALAGELSPSMVERVIERLGKAKRRRRAKVQGINRNRKAITSARTSIKKIMTDFFAHAVKDLARQIVAARSAVLGKADPSSPSDDDVDAVLDALDFSDWDTLRTQLEPVLIGVAQDGIQVAFDQINVDGTDIVDQVNEKAVDWARERAAELVGKTYDEDGALIDNPNPEMAITESTREMLRTSVTRAIEDGTSTDDLADELSDTYGFSDTRASAIARYEIGQADVQGNMMAYRDSGVVDGKEWVLGSEHDQDDECDDAADMGVVPLDDDFGGIGDPPAHPNCVCDVLPVLADDSE